MSAEIDVALMTFPFSAVLFGFSSNALYRYAVDVT